MSNVPSVAERNEVIQDVIDRMLYLSDKNRDEFLYYIGLLKDKYPISYRVVGGIRVYEQQKPALCKTSLN